MADNVTRVSVKPENAYLARLKAAPTDIPPGTLIQTTEKNTDVPVGTCAYVVEGPLTGEYDWPVYLVRWLGDDPSRGSSSHLAGAFFKVLSLPVELRSITDVEEFLNG